MMFSSREQFTAHEWVDACTVIDTDLPQHNPTNPILVAFRDYVNEATTDSFIWSAGFWLDQMADPNGDSEARALMDEAVLAADPHRDPARATADAWERHAQLVLTRLLNFLEESA